MQEIKRQGTRYWRLSIIW